MSKLGINQDNYDLEALNSPFSRVYLCPQTEQIINCALGLKYPIDLEALKKAFSNSIMVKHPRFCSLMVRNPKGQDQWKRTKLNIDDHFIIHYPKTDPKTDLEKEEEMVNSYLADFALSSPLRQDKPLWEVHVLMGLKCIVLRVHHALGDGVSLMSMLSNCFGQKREAINGVNCDSVKKIKHAKNSIKWKDSKIWVLIMSLWLTIVYGLRLLWRFLWVKDEVSVLSGGDGVERWPRILVTNKFKIEDFKSIKMAFPNATVNDALLGIISCGISKYVNGEKTEALKRSNQVTAILMVNLRRQICFQEKAHVNSTKDSCSCEFPLWGNKTGLVLLPMDCNNGLHPLDHARTMKAIMDKKKHSYEAHITYWALKLCTFFLGPKVASWCCHRMLCNTTLLISNIMGPSEEIAIANNPVSYIRVNISSQPHAMTMHLVSYAGKADLQLMMAKDIITNPDLLAKCIKDSLFEMKNSMTREPIV